MAVVFNSGLRVNKPAAAGENSESSSMVEVVVDNGGCSGQHMNVTLSPSNSLSASANTPASPPPRGTGLRDKESEMPLSSSGGSSDFVSEIGVVRDCRWHCYHRYGTSPFVIEESLKLCLRCCGVIHTAVTHLHAHRWNAALRALEVVAGVEGVEDEEGERGEREEEEDKVVEESQAAKEGKGFKWTCLRVPPIHRLRVALLIITRRGSRGRRRSDRLWRGVNRTAQRRRTAGEAEAEAFGKTKSLLCKRQVCRDA